MSGPRPAGHRPISGLCLLELLITVAMALPAFAIIAFLLMGALKSFAGLSVAGQIHAEFLTLREYLSRDIQHASQLVEQVSLDGTSFQTRTGPAADSLVLQLPAVGREGNVVPQVYDFVVYRAVPEAYHRGASLVRELFIKRDANGRLLDLPDGSARVPETKTLVKALVAATPDGTGPALFTLDRPVVSLAREVRLTITIQETESAHTRRTFLQTYAATFRLRNG